VSRLVLVVAVVALAGCGGGGDEGTATVWITRDRGATVLRTATVPAGVTAMQALDRVADVETRYGGRFVQAIDGVEGSVSGRRDWFYFVNGLEADRGAAEYRLHPGDVEWWDYRSWRGAEVRAVVGAFPEPFLHGYAGRVRPAAVRYRSVGLRAAATGIARRIAAAGVRPASVAVPRAANAFVVVPGRSLFAAHLEPSGRVRFVASADVVQRLLANTSAYRFRYRVP
jgi:hypothetical protein